MNEMQRRERAACALGDALPLDASWERRQPARVGDLRGDLLLPLGQALVTGLVGGIVGVLVGGGRTGLISGVAVFGMTWLALRSIVTHRPQWLLILLRTPIHRANNGQCRSRPP